MVSLVLLALATVRAQNVGTVNISLAERYFNQAEGLSNADGGRTWGVSLYGPMMFADPASRNVVANGPDKEGKLTRRGSVWIGKLSDNNVVANTAAEFGGVRWTIVMWPLPELERPRGRLMMHECYHRIQDGLGLPGRDAQLPHLDGKNGRIWLRLEMRALAVALDDAGALRLQAVHDALLFRAERRALCGVEASKGEQMLELNEGLAEYTGFRLSGYPRNVLPDRAAVALEREQGSSTFARSFAYATGPAYGQLLDIYGPLWRKKLNATSDLSDLLAAATRFHLPAHLDSEANRRGMSYEGDVVIGQESERAKRRMELTRKYKERFVSGHVLSLPTTSNFNYSYDPNAVDSLEGYGTVYIGGRFTDDWGVLTVDAGTALVTRNGGVQLRVSAPTQVDGKPIVGDGWSLELNSGWKLIPGARAGDWTVAKG